MGMKTRKGKASKDNCKPSYRQILSMEIFAWTLSRSAMEVGAVGVLCLKESKKIYFKEALGEGTNSRAKLNFVWLLIRPTTEKGVYIFKF
jgi:hypothetical protein